MPKVKSKSRVKKCVFLSGSGKLMRRHGFLNHFLNKKSNARKDRLSRNGVIAQCDLHRFRKMLNI